LKNTTGQENTAVGVDAMLSNTTGSNNIALGYQAGSSLTTGHNDVDIGSLGVAAESNTIRIGTEGKQTATYVAGIFDSAVTGDAVVVSNTGRLGIVRSAARYKRDIHDMDEASSNLMKLRPVTFRYKDDPQGMKQYGLVAEQVRQVYPELVTYDGHGKLESVRYQELVPMLLNEVQRQQRDLAELRAENRTLRSALLQVQGRVEQMAAQLPNLAHR
jgi:hypothetical protein